MLNALAALNFVCCAAAGERYFIAKREQEFRRFSPVLPIFTQFYPFLPSAARLLAYQYT